MHTSPEISRRNFLRSSALAGGVVATGGLLAACSRTDTSSTVSGDTLARIKKSGTVTVGFANERPYAFRDNNGNLVGEAPSIHGEIFKRIGGIKLQPRLYEFDSLIPALNAGRVDVVTAGMFIEPDRCKQAAFSNPEYAAPEALLVKKGNPRNLSDYASVAKTGATLAVMTGAVEGDQAKAYHVKNVQTVADQTSGLDAVKSGRADAFALTSISLRWAAQSDSSVEVLTPFTPVVNGVKQIGAGAAVFRLKDDPLREAFDKELADILASGLWLKLVKPWGFTEAEKPTAGMTAEKFCKA